MNLTIQELLDENSNSQLFWIESAKTFIKSLKVYLKKHNKIDRNLTIGLLTDIMFKDEDCKYIITPLYHRFSNSSKDDGGIFIIQMLIGVFIRQDEELISLIKFY